jgi:hypothetical protein
VSPLSTLLLRHFALVQVVAVVEHLVELCPPSQQLAHLLVQQLLPHASDAAWVSWLLPLLLGIMVRSDPGPPLGEWLGVLRVVQVQCPGAMEPLLEVALQQHPWSDALWGMYVKDAASEALGGGDIWEGTAVLVAEACAGSGQEA